jgi:D-tyrosyl-tRNA(Tyr) deacylase
VILLGVGENDAESEVELLANKIANLRIFADVEGKFNLSALDVKAEMLVVSQFTLYADCRKGRRPSFTGAARPEVASPLCDNFVEKLRAMGFKVETGEFQADMLVEIHNSGPVTIWLDTGDLSRAK